MTGADAPALSLAELEAILEAASDRSHAANTRKTYATSMRVFTQWCRSHQLSPLPADAHTLGLFAAHLASLRRSPNTITTWVSAIRSVHRRPEIIGLPAPARPYPVPDDTQAEQVIRAHRRDLAEGGWSPHQAEAMLKADLRKIRGTLDWRRPIAVRDWAILTLGFAMGARASELSCLNIEDVALDPDDPTWMWVRLCMSKTDQDAAGTMVTIPRGHDHTLCAVRAVLEWIAWLRTHGRVQSGPLFRHMSGRGDKLAQHGMARHPDALEGRLQPDGISLVFSRRSVRAGIATPRGALKRFTSHSGRRGGATEAARAGARETEMCDHFRWKRGSKMASLYVAEADAREHNPMSRVM